MWWRCSASISATRCWRWRSTCLGLCGILSLGHGAFFALGGYAMGMYLMRQIGDRGVYGNPVLPDFMVFLNWKELPWYWHGFDQFWFALLMVVLVPGLLAFVFGWLAFRSRVTGVYLLDHHPGADLCAAARLLPQRHGLRRQQRPDRLQGHPRLQRAGRRHARRALRASALALARLAYLLAASSSPRSSARCWWRCATPRAARASSATGSSTTSCSCSSSRRAGRHRRRALRAAGRHHQSGEFSPATRSRPSSGSRSAGAARWSARCSAPAWSTTPRPGSPARCPTGLAVRARRASSSSSTLFLPRGHRRPARTPQEAPPATTTPRPGGRAMSRSLTMLDARSAPDQNRFSISNGVTVSFDGFKALNDLSLVRRGGRAALPSSAPTAPARRP
jgi:hypothetical protein